MTIIAARVFGDKTTMSCDSALSENNGDLVTVGHKKIWKPNEHLIIGFCGDWECFSALRHRHVVEKREAAWFPPKHSVERWLYNNLAAGLEKRFSGEKEYSMLVGTRGGLYEVDSAGAVSAFSETYAALGSGVGFARGAMFAGALPVEAVRAAIFYTGNCREPIFSESIDNT